MSTLMNQVEELKNFKAPSILEGVNKIYFLEVVQKPGLVKIGDTHREVAERNAESIINASLMPVQDAPWQVAEKFDGSVFRDKTFHKFLEKKGYERELNHKGSKSEWFFITRFF